MKYIILLAFVFGGVGCESHTYDQLIEITRPDHSKDTIMINGRDMKLEGDVLHITDRMGVFHPVDSNVRYYRLIEYNPHPR